MKHAATVLIAALLMTGCERVGANEWSEIDYARIARDNYRRENDMNYIPPPSVIGCADDDLINCRSGRRYY
jgi:hypothetical protein